MKSFDTLDNWHEEFLKQVYYVSSIFLILLLSVICMVTLFQMLSPNKIIGYTCKKKIDSFECIWGLWDKFWI